MHIVHFSTELAPIAKIGGLGDVVYGLSKQLLSLGHKVEVILPKYDTIDYGHVKNLQVHYKDLISFDGSERIPNTIWSAELEGIQVLLIEPHHPAQFFQRGSIYGCSDNIDRFLYFTRTAMEFLFKSGRSPDTIHLHDWPVAIASTLYKDMYIPLGFKTGGMLLTLHNTEHQGVCSPHNFTRIGLEGEKYISQEKYQDTLNPMNLNLLKGGIEDASAITAVSPTYCKEIMTAQGGHGLHTILLRNAHKLLGILNGIDQEFWDPSHDPHLVHRYDTTAPLTEAKLEKIQGAKKENKGQLRKHLGLRPSSGPLVGCVTRLAAQKGPELIAEGLRRTIELGGQFILLGSEYTQETKDFFLGLKKEYEGTQDLGMTLDRDESLAHLLFAGSDIITVPSLFEPCGLTQMIALRYGSLPLVRKTGGLADTVFDISSSDKPKELRNGFVFESPTKEGICSALDRAFDIWKRDQDTWRQLIKHALTCDFSWRKSAKEYVKIYQKLSKTKSTSPQRSSKAA